MTDSVSPTARRLLLLGGIELSGVESEAANAVLSQPKAVAFIALLALSPERRFQRRDRIAALLWPELDQGHARTALRKVLYVVRGALGPESVPSRGDEEVAWNGDAFPCDVVEFTMRADAGHLERAIELYRGELMPGFHVAGCGDFDLWLYEERSAARERIAAAEWALACRHETDQSFTQAGRLVRRAVRHSGADERVLRRALRMLERLGDRAGALHLYDEFAQQMWQAFEAEPSDETKTLVASLRERRSGAPGA